MVVQQLPLFLQLLLLLLLVLPLSDLVHRLGAEKKKKKELVEVEEKLVEVAVVKVAVL